MAALKHAFMVINYLQKKKDKFAELKIAVRIFLILIIHSYNLGLVSSLAWFSEIQHVGYSL